SHSVVLAGPAVLASARAARRSGSPLFSLNGDAKQKGADRIASVSAFACDGASIAFCFQTVNGLFTDFPFFTILPGKEEKTSAVCVFQTLNRPVLFCFARPRPFSPRGSPPAWPRGVPRLFRPGRSSSRRGAGCSWQRAGQK